MEGVSQSLPITVAGRTLSFDRRKRWERYKNGCRRLTVWVITLLVVFFGYDTITQLAYGNIFDMIGIPIVAAGVVLTVLFAATEPKHSLRDLQTAWYNEQADQARLTAGIRIDLYDDRAVRTDLRSTVTLFYRELTVVTETADGFFLQAGDREIFISGADLTPWQAAQIAERLQSVAAEVFRLKKRTVATLTEPLPLPVLATTDTVISRGSITLARPLPAEQYRRVQMRTVTGWVLPMAAVLGATLGCWMSLFDILVADMLLFAGFCMAAAVLLSLFGSSLGKRKTVVRLVITRDGIGGFANGASDFLVWGRTRVSATAHGLRLTLPDDIPLSIPWRCLEHPEAVQQFLNIEIR